MTRDINQYKALLPEYINNHLDADVRTDLERHIRTDDGLKKELEELNHLKKSYAGLAEKIPGPSSSAFSRIMENIGTPEIAGREELRSGPTLRAGLGQWIDILRNRLAAPKTAWAFAAVQMAVIIVMAVVLLSSSENQSYQTLSAGSFLSAPVIHINVVFDGSAMEEEIRSLLTGLHAGIVGGPDRNGLYVIAIPEDRDIDQAVMQLKNSDIVKFVQKKI